MSEKRDLYDFEKNTRFDAICDYCDKAFEQLKGKFGSNDEGWVSALTAINNLTNGDCAELPNREVIEP